MQVGVALHVLPPANPPGAGCRSNDAHVLNASRRFPACVADSPATVRRLHRLYTLFHNRRAPPFFFTARRLLALFHNRRPPRFYFMVRRLLKVRNKRSIDLLLLFLTFNNRRPVR